MTRFDPSSHPRDTTGKFAAKRTAPNPALLHQLEAQAGDDLAARRDLAERLCGQLIESPAEFLVSTGGGRLFVEVAAPVDGHGGGCLDCDTQTNGPSFVAIDARTGDTWGAYGAQCGGCGWLGAGWVCSGAAEVDVTDPEDFEELIGGLIEEVTVEAARRADLAGPTVAQAAAAVTAALADVEDLEDVTLFPPDPDSAGGVFYDAATGQFGCWLPGIAAEDGRDVQWSVTVRSEADLAAARTAAARVGAAARPWAPPEALADLAADDDAGVRRAVALHKNTPPAALVALAADPDETVRAAASANPNLPAAGKAAGGLLA